MNLDEQKQTLFNRIVARENEQWIISNIIFATIHGSTCYGLATETSDIDISGIMIPPRDYFLGFMKNVEQFVYSEPDGTVFNIKKFFALAADANPNVMELLWVEPKYWIYQNEKFFSRLLEKRDLFLSSKVRYTYSGYAHAQLKRINTHRRWLLEPPSHKPTREEFALPETRTITRDQQGALNALDEEVTLSDNFMALLQKENAYTNAKRNWEQYENWRKTRNPIRAKMEAKQGYDTKHAAHLIRLMRQCVEMLETGILKVERPDREELLDIRRGAWSYDALMLYVEAKFTDERLDELYAKTSLPHAPAREKLHNLCDEIIYDFITK